MLRTMTVAAVVCVAVCHLQAGETRVRRAILREEPQVRLTGHLATDLRAPGAPGLDTGVLQVEQEGLPGRKSPWLAAGLSLLLPGAGELYAESYWKAALFFAADVAAWTVAYTQDRKGDDQTAFFEGFANQHWDVTRYASWTHNNSGQINSSVNPTAYDDIFLPGGGVNWARLNDFERALGNWYSHTLPPYGAQQYYELIGKYQQFYHGWDDANPALLTYEDITRELSPNFRYYSAERGKANTYYSRASTAVTIAILNRVISALDAAWTAASYNGGLEAQMGTHTIPFGTASVTVPAARIAYRF